MPSHSEYITRVRELDWNGLRALWMRIKAGHTPGWPPGKAFEHLVLRAFELDGAEVRWPYLVRHGGEVVEEIDGAVYAADLSCLVETKDTAGLVDVTFLAKMRNQLARRPACTLGLFFSRSGFTDAAITLVSYFAPQTVLLWRGEEMDYLLGNEFIVAGLLEKYRRAVEDGPVYYNLELGRTR
ncbi:restriction endonuclease [Longimicrobium sp.]|uniref:restriction endonuclease n=1 Tax=Longimicrobium sp. TaxID=2029185 RepID=UPI002CCE2891|nr:restriction endonuclease [Longimicrobium sp.]HSU13491.1 restriction endonuclease [Longimicrobium sp.]